MQKISIVLSALLLASSQANLAAATPTMANQSKIEVIENKKVAQVVVNIENLPKGAKYDPRTISSTLRTKTGEPFSQRVFDHDLKKLSDEYERVDPTVHVKDGKVYIKIALWEKPFVRAIRFNGNSKMKTKTLQKELGIKANTQYNKDEFIKAFNSLKEYYVKKGYFEAKLSYRIIHIPQTNEIRIDITVHEGRSAHIDHIKFEGLSKKEQSHILTMINTKKYNFFTSWLTGRGTYHPEAMEQDRLTVVNYLQNEGYADAHVEIKFDESKKQNIIILIKAEKGPLFHFGKITFEGNVIKNDEEVTESMGVAPGDPYGPEQLRLAKEAIERIYGQKGYIDTNVRYDLRLSQHSPIYDVHFIIEESEQFKIGVIRVLGNVSTNTNVILNSSSIAPGEICDADKLKATQGRLQGLGYFKSVNVYFVRNPDDVGLGPQYRDVNIEVQETSTGSASLFFGASSTDSVSGGLDVTENNFNIAGLGRIFKTGIAGLRGGGQYAHAKVTVGKRFQTYTVSWLDPYLNDSLWRFGFDMSYSRSRITDKNFRSDATSLNLYASLPLSAYWTYGWKYRISNTVINVAASSSPDTQRQALNSGIVSGVGLYFGYDSTDNIFRPHRGFRSTFESEIAGVRRHDQNTKDFLFTKMFLTNAYYYPLWAKGTFKTRLDLKFLAALGAGQSILLPANERFYLGGDNTVRGYQPGVIGPKYTRTDGSQTNDPQGGASSALFSVEYLQYIFQPLDAFIFFDAGSVARSQFSIHEFMMSAGGGLRIDIGGQLPLVVGYGWPLNLPKNPDGTTDDAQANRFFFSMGGQF